MDGCMYACRFGRKLKNIEEVLAPPEDAFEFFKPHGFDEKEVGRILGIRRSRLLW